MMILTVKDRQGVIQNIEISEHEEYNLMEILKSKGYKMRATCGGMGLCADCLCRIDPRESWFPDPSDQENETLDTLPEVYGNSRLSCQIKPGVHLDGLLLSLSGKDEF